VTIAPAEPKGLHVPASLAEMAGDAGLGLADVAFLAGLDESTVSRLWSDPQWLDRITGSTLQHVIAAIPGIGGYVAFQPLAARLSRLSAALADAGLHVDPAGIRAAQDGNVAAPHVANALNAALHVVRGDIPKASSHLARLWGKDQDPALTRLFSPGPDRLLVNPGHLICASAEMAPHLRRRGRSFHAMLAEAAVAHYAHVDLPPVSESKISDRQEALSLRSSVMGTLISDNDFDAADRYEHRTARTPLLMVIEEWSFPTYTRDTRPDPGFSLPRSILLRNTAAEVIREIGIYSDAYVHYLLSVYVPLALSRDPTFGLAVSGLKTAIRDRLSQNGDPRLTSVCEATLRSLEGRASD
jgi:hypothetical protein